MEPVTKPVHPHVGVELAASSALSPAIAEALPGLLARHGFVLLRSQDLGPADLIALARALGVPLPPYRPQYSVPGFPELVQIGNLRDGGEVGTYLNRGGVEWHSDSPGSSHPAGCSLLYCLESELPDGGGETGFASTVRGYEALPDALKAQTSDVELVHSFNTFNDQVAAYAQSAVSAQDGQLRERNADTHDFLVQVHPDTGAPYLYVSYAMVKGYRGIDEKAGRRLVRDVVDHVTAPHLVYKHVWKPGDLVVFDNRTCLHTPFPYAYDDFPRTRRHLQQIIIGAER